MKWTKYECRPKQCLGKTLVPLACDNMILTKTLKVNCVGIIVIRQNLYVMFTLKMHKNNYITTQKITVFTKKRAL